MDPEKNKLTLYWRHRSAGGCTGSWLHSTPWLSHRCHWWPEGFSCCTNHMWWPDTGRKGLITKQKLCNEPHSKIQFPWRERCWPCSGEPLAWWRSTFAGPLPCRQRSADGSGYCRGRGRPACGLAAELPTGDAVRKAVRTGSKLPEHWPAPEGLQRKDYGKDGHTNAQLDLLDTEHKVTRMSGEWQKEQQWKEKHQKTQKAQKNPKGDSSEESS